MIRNSKGIIEMIMLLCCLVGIVAFFCFGLGITSILLQPPGGDELQRKFESLKKEKEQKVALVKQFENEKRDLERQKEEMLEAKAGEEKLTEAQRREMEKDLAGLKEERDRLNQKIEQLKKEIARLRLQGLPDPRKKNQMEDKLQTLRKKLGELEKRIKEIMVLIAQSDKDAKTDNSSDDENKLKKEINKLQEERKKMEKEVQDLKTRYLWRGSSQFKNPLFVDCREEVYIFYPEGDAVAVMELENRNVFEEKAKGHDIIVLLVRPEGYESFRKAYAKIKTMSIARSYEPVKTEVDLSFLREKDEKR